MPLLINGSAENWQMVSSLSIGKGDDECKHMDILLIPNKSWEKLMYLVAEST